MPEQMNSGCPSKECHSNLERIRVRADNSVKTNIFTWIIGILVSIFLAVSGGSIWISYSIAQDTKQELSDIKTESKLAERERIQNQNAIERNQIIFNNLIQTLPLMIKDAVRDGIKENEKEKQLEKLRNKTSKIMNDDVS